MSSHRHVPPLDSWLERRTFHHSQFSDLTRLLFLKRERGVRVSVALPTLNEGETIGAEVRTIRQHLVERVPLVDQIAVVDSGSTDRTRQIAEREGAATYLASDIRPDQPVWGGKGENLWRSLFVLDGDLIVWLDADIKNIHPKFVYGPLGPLLAEPQLAYVKAFYDRPLHLPEGLRPSGGGRVTELLVRPFLATFFPELSLFLQPLSGEYAGRRDVLEQLPFCVGYGVEVGLLIDIADRFGLDSMAQVDLDRRIHRNREVHELSRMSFSILQTLLAKLKATGRAPADLSWNDVLCLIEARGQQLLARREPVPHREHPPAASLRHAAAARPAPDRDPQQP